MSTSTLPVIQCKRGESVPDAVQRGIAEGVFPQGSVMGMFCIEGKSMVGRVRVRAGCYYPVLA